MFWNVLRTWARQSILAGVNDAITDLGNGPTQDAADAATTLRSRVLALPAVPAAEPDAAVAAGKRVKAKA